MRNRESIVQLPLKLELFDSLLFVSLMVAIITLVLLKFSLSAYFAHKFYKVYIEEHKVEDPDSNETPRKS